jgi:hypothetical protein
MFIPNRSVSKFLKTGAEREKHPHLFVMSQLVYRIVKKIAIAQIGIKLS